MPRSDWTYEIIDQRTESGLVLFEYVVREPGLDPFLLNNHKAQIRTNHQRVLKGPSGGMMHVSGVEVLADDLEAFMLGSEWYRWVDKDRQGRWVDNRNRRLAPFLFPAAPWAGGLNEELDPQWQREAFTVTEATQIDDCIKRYLDRAAIKGWTGDRRGTTLNLQVGASADDARESFTLMSIVATTFNADTQDSHFHGFRWRNVTIANAATINSAILTVFISDAALDEPRHNLWADDVDDAAIFTTTDSDISGRTKTTAVDNWDDTALGTTTGFTQWGAIEIGEAGGHDLSPLVQEIVDRALWASNNSIAMFDTPSAAGTVRDLGINFYDNDTTQAAKLDTDYTAGGADPESNLVGGKLLHGGLLVGGGNLVGR